MHAKKVTTQVLFLPFSFLRVSSQSFIINIYASSGGLILFGWLWGLNLIVWQSVGLDYASILGFKTPLMNIQQVYLEVSFATMVFLGDIIFFYKLLREPDGLFTTVPVYVMPVLLIFFCMYKMVFPWSHRREIWLTIFQVVFSPFCEVRKLLRFIFSLLGICLTW